MVSALTLSSDTRTTAGISLILLVYAGAVALPAGVLALRHRASDA
jgi:hypothetical protein